ncbi:MAG: hypothetical protein PHP62_04770 [Candidatus Moranbacteria bacterium]|nr:hypothetical protein [Candidatus Moranbacteria bacterium]
MKNLIQDTLAKIEKQHIVPEAKWRYLLKKYGLWLLFIIVLILTAVSFSVAFDNSSSLDWDLYRFMRQNRFAYILSILPYFWIILIGIFLIVAFFEIRRTETGYRYSWFKIFLITLGGIGIFGILISPFGLGGKLNSKLTKEVPFYGQHMLVTKNSQWTQPEKGFLAGTIVSFSGNELGIDDLNGKDWNIQIDEKTSIRPSVNISKEEMIKIIGTKQDANNFKADEIRPWSGNGMGRGANGRSGGAANDNGRRGGMMQGK